MKKALAIVALAASLVACGANVAFVMRSAESAEVPVPASGMANVVFLMPGGRGDPVSFVDESGAFIGQARAGTFFVVDVAPGAHRYYALRGASAYVVHAEVEAGRTYHVLVEAGTLAGIRVVGLRPGDATRWTRREGWLRDARHVEPDPQGDRASLERQLGNVPQRMLEADTELGQMSEAEQADRRLSAGDGLETAEPEPPAEPEPAPDPEPEPAPAEPEPASEEPEPGPEPASAEAGEASPAAP